MSGAIARVLIAEDDPIIARVLQRTLLREGFEADVAEDGTEALAALEKARYDYLLCDYQLPGMTGDELCRCIRSSRRYDGLPIALCSAKAHEVDLAGLVAELGLDQVFFKPFSLKQITSAISAAVNSAIGSSAG